MRKLVVQKGTRSRPGHQKRTEPIRVAGVLSTVQRQPKSNILCSGTTPRGIRAVAARGQTGRPAPPSGTCASWYCPAPASHSLQDLDRGGVDRVNQRKPRVAVMAAQVMMRETAGPSGPGDRHSTLVMAGAPMLLCIRGRETDWPPLWPVRRFIGGSRDRKSRVPVPQKKNSAPPRGDVSRRKWQWRKRLERRRRRRALLRAEEKKVSGRHQGDASLQSLKPFRERPLRCQVQRTRNRSRC